MRVSITALIKEQSILYLGVGLKASGDTRFNVNLVMFAYARWVLIHQTFWASAKSVTVLRQVGGSFEILQVCDGRGGRTEQLILKLGLYSERDDRGYKETYLSRIMQIS